MSEESGDQRLAAAIPYARRGDRDALGYLWCRFVDDVVDVVSIVDKREAEEIARSVFAVLPATIARYDPALDGAFRGWLLQTAFETARLLDAVSETRCAEG